jgi:hypothetical protein
VFARVRLADISRHTPAPSRTLKSASEHHCQKSMLIRLTNAEPHCAGLLDLCDFDPSISPLSRSTG